MVKRKLTEYLSLLPLIDDEEVLPLIDGETTNYRRYKYLEETPHYLIRRRYLVKRRRIKRKRLR